jgi:PRP38 family
MQQYGNATTFNIEKVLYQNAIDSLYFKNNCVKLSTFEELVDEVIIVPASGLAVQFSLPHISMRMNCTCDLMSTLRHQACTTHRTRSPMLMGADASSV